MDSAAPAYASRHAGVGLMRSIAKLVSLRRAVANTKRETDLDAVVYKVKPPEFHDSDDFPQSDGVGNEGDHSDDEKGSSQTLHKEAMEALLARVFAGVSAFKASYAQLQLAQSPYSPEDIQSADLAIVAELKRLSQLKQLHLSNDYANTPFCSAESISLSQIQEQRCLIETFKVTAKKLEEDLRRKDCEIHSLKQRLQEENEQNKLLEMKSPPPPRLTQPNATHFLQSLQLAMKSVRVFVKALESSMEDASWDLSAAAGVVAPAVAHGDPRHRTLAFEAFVCRAVFEGFQRQDFGLALPPAKTDRGGYLAEFVELGGTTLEELLDGRAVSPFGYFLKAKFRALLRPKMEEALFGGLEMGTLVESGMGYPKTAFFLCFAEMARRVWALHRLFCSFDAAEVFAAAKGERFSEVYMVSAAEEDDGEAAPVVGFAVSPGFQVAGVVVQCRVYLIRRDERS